jgi:outer membrane protein assembly factor BamB
MYRAILISVCFSFLVSVSVAENSVAENWGHWRGPDGNSVAPDADPPTRWSETENIKWKVEIPGVGSGSPVIWGDRVFVVSAVAGASAEAGEASSQNGRKKKKPIPNLEFKVFCFDRDSGDQKWEATATVAKPHERTHQTNGYASASPCTDGKHVYAHFGSRGIYCYTMDGQFVWKRDDLGEMKIRFSFGEGSSPTIAEDKIIIPWDHQGDSYLLALNKLTGETIWKTPRDEPSCWGTPLVVEHGSTKQVVMQGQNFARSYDLETGTELWRCAGQTFRPVATPVAENGLVIVGSGFRGAFMGAFQLDGTGDIEGSTSVSWTVDRDTPDIASPLLSGGRLYFYKGKTGILSCLDAKTGEPHFSAQRISGIRSTYASPVAAGGNVYLTDRDGTIVVIKDSEELNIVSTNSLGEGVDATPAPAGDQLFVRGAKHLFCIAK